MLVSIFVSEILPIFIHSVLVGNKCDLENQRQVKKEEGEQLGMFIFCVCVLMVLGTHCHFIFI